MAKSEHVEVLEGDEEEGFDQEALLRENLADLPEKQEVRGRWKVQWVTTFIKGGTKNGRIWARVNLGLDPIEPVGEDAQEVAAEYDLEDLPRGYHSMRYVTIDHKRAFVALMKKFGVAPDTLVEMIENGRGQYITATISQGKDNLGRPEMKFSSFAPVGNDEIPF